MWFYMLYFNEPFMGVTENPIVESIYFDSNDQEANISPSNSFLLLDGGDFLLLDGDYFTLLEA